MVLRGKGFNPFELFSRVCGVLRSWTLCSCAMLMLARPREAWDAVGLSVSPLSPEGEELGALPSARSSSDTPDGGGSFVVNNNNIFMNRT